MIASVRAISPHTAGSCAAVTSTFSGWNQSSPSCGSWASTINTARALTKPAITGCGTKRI